MRHRTFDLAFTPAVMAEQEHYGCRAAYAAAAAGEAGPDALPGALPGALTGALTRRERRFIAARDTFYLAIVSQTGWPYVQHRGGPPGFVRVLDDGTIGWAEFAGNQQYVSAGNVSLDDRVALLFIDFAGSRRLKLLGHLRSFDPAERPDLESRLALDGYRVRVERYAVVAVEGVDWTCPQHITPRLTAGAFAAAAHPRADLAASSIHAVGDPS